MNLGLKRGFVELLPHQEMWDDVAKATISLLNEVLDNIVVGIEHVGSTAVRDICAKPIIDIAIGVKNIDDILPYIEDLEKKEIIFRGSDVSNQYLFVVGDFNCGIITHHIHIVGYGSIAWNNYIKFRDYLNSSPDKAKEYEALKRKLVLLHPDDRVAYTNGKQDFINSVLSV